MPQLWSHGAWRCVLDGGTLRVIRGGRQVDERVTRNPREARAHAEIWRTAVASVAEAVSPDASPRPSAPTLLVVEDDDDLRELFRTTLTLEGFCVLESRDGLDALRKVDAHRPDAIVLDMQLPRISGYGVLYDLGVKPHSYRTPVVVVTAFEGPIVHPRVSRLLRKPVLPEALVQAVRECLPAAPVAR